MMAALFAGSPLLSACDRSNSGGTPSDRQPNPGSQNNPNPGADDKPEKDSEPEEEGGDPCLRNKGGVAWESQLLSLGKKGVEAAVAASHFDQERNRMFLGLSGLLDVSGPNSVSSHSLVALSTIDKKPRWEQRHAGEYVGDLEFLTGIGVNPDGSVMTSVREVRNISGAAEEQKVFFHGWLGHYSEVGVELNQEVFEQTEANPDSLGPRPAVSHGIPGGGLLVAGTTDYEAEDAPGTGFKAFFRVYNDKLEAGRTFYYSAKDVDLTQDGMTDVREVVALEGGGILAIIEGHRSLNESFTHLVRFDKEGKELWDTEIGTLLEFDPSGIAVTEKGDIWISGARNYFKGGVPKDPNAEVPETFWRKYWVAHFSSEGKLLDSFEGAAPGSSMAKPDNAAMATDIAIDRVGNVWLAGTYSVTVMNAPEEFRCQHYSWAKKLDPKGKVLWHKEMKTDEYKYRFDAAVSIDVDEQCNGYLVSNYSRRGDQGHECKLVPAVTKLNP